MSILNSHPCRKAMTILSNGPDYLTGHHYGRRQPGCKARVPTRTALIHINTAGKLIAAGVAKISRTGRPDRSDAFMLWLSPFGRSLVAAMGAKLPKVGT